MRLPAALLVPVCAALLLTACGGGGGGAGGTSPDAAPATPPVSTPTAPPMTQRDAVRLASQATFGATEPLIAQMRAQSAAAWVQAQINLPPSARYTSGGGTAIHTDTSGVGYCDQPAHQSDTCWRD